MKLIVFSVSRPFASFLDSHLTNEIEIHPTLSAPVDDSDQLYLLHISGMELEGFEWLLKHVSGKPIKVGVCSDLPNLYEMLECVRLGAKAYCNSRMAAGHYRQMLRLVGQGQSWFPPHLLDETFRLAQQAVKPQATETLLTDLTAREKEIALSVSVGKSNRQIADHFKISEATVKTHLSSIYKKLEIKDRVGLVLYLKQG